MSNAPHYNLPAATDDERYAELATEDGLILYDRENHRAWIQSSAAVSLEGRR